MLIYSITNPERDEQMVKMLNATFPRLPRLSIETDGALPYIASDGTNPQDVILWGNLIHAYRMGWCGAKQDSQDECETVKGIEYSIYKQP